MGRRPLGDRPLTDVERQARKLKRKAARMGMLISALEQIQAAKTIREARKIAAAALESEQ